MAEGVSIEGEWANINRPLYIQQGMQKSKVYLRIRPDSEGVTQGITHVRLSDLFEGLAKAFGKRITVADIEVIPATTVVKNEVVYGG